MGLAKSKNPAGSTVVFHIFVIQRLTWDPYNAVIFMSSVLSLIGTGITVGNVLVIPQSRLVSKAVSYKSLLPEFLGFELPTSFEVSKSTRVDNRDLENDSKHHWVSVRISLKKILFMLTSLLDNIKPRVLGNVQRSV